MSMFIRSMLVVAGGTLLASSAQAVTVATFADPAIDGSTPLFQFDSGTNTLSGGWGALGLTLETPGLPAGDYSNAKFTMTNVTCNPIGPQLYSTGAGQLNFFDSANVLLLTMTFASGSLNTASFGASDFAANNVTFSGPIIGFPVTQEAFAFSFANPVSVSPAGSFTATASMTSSATIPAPGAAALLGIGGLMVARRRR